MENVKCECGHVNPHGTIFCEACGKPVENFDNKDNADHKDGKLLNMRYEGSARRSQTYKKTVIDKIWNFFSSVKVGVWLIVITLIASSLGTLFPQELFIPPNVPPEKFYEQEYGIVGRMYYELGFHNLYGSWWFMILVASIAISLVICSLDRVVPLYRALKNQGVKRHANFLKRQRLFSSTSIKEEEAEQAYEKVKAGLKKKNYRIREENGNLLAEKGRFSRWGPYVNHVGLIIFLIGAMLRFFPGMYVDEVLWLREGETKVVPGTNGQYYLENEEFIKELYGEDGEEMVMGMGLPKNFQTNAVLYERKGEIVPGKEPELEKIKEHQIRVNQPLKHDSFAWYQVDYKENEFSKMIFNLANKETGETFGEVAISLDDPSREYVLDNGYRVELMDYFPNFTFDAEGNPSTKNRIPDNPAFIFKMYTPETTDGEVSFVGIRTNIEPQGTNQYKMAFSNIETRDVTALVVRLDHTLWIIGIGGFIFMIGVVQGMYWHHRRVWVQRVNGEIWIAGHTNKSWHSLKKDIQSVVDDTPLNMTLDQQEEKREKAS